MSTNINESLLIFPVTFQDTLTDKMGNLLVNGTIYLYSNNARTTLKNWYYQTGTVEPYNYLPLPNPMTLDASGNISDLNGQIVLPGFYPYASDNVTPETYFIQIYDQYGTLVQTIYNFPINPSGAVTSTVEDIKQLITNNRFWRNAGPGTLTLTDEYSAIVAPDQHDGYSTGTTGYSTPQVNGYLREITFNKNTTGSTESVTFTKFPLTQTPALQNDITPEFYLNHVCTVAGGGETLKYYQFPLSLHLRTLNSVEACASIQAMGTGTIYLAYYQYQGTGQSSVTPTPFLTINLSTTWTKYSIFAQIPSDAGTTVDSGPGDDAIYLWVGINPGICDVSFTLPSVYLLNNVNAIPTNDFKNYDEINTVISSPRTGDVRIGLNSYASWGWAPMNDGVLCNSGTITLPTGLGLARQNIDAWPLFNLLWKQFKQYDTGSNFNPICQMYTSAGSATNYGATAIADWNALNLLQLTSMMGQVILGTVPASSLIPLYSSTFTGSSTTITVASTADLFTGMPVTFTGTTTLTVGVIYYIGVINGTTFHVYTSFSNAIIGSSAQNVDASGTYIAAATGTGEGEYAHTQQLAELAAHTHTYFHPTSNNVGGSGSSFPETQGSDNTGSTGSSTPFNVTQPGTFLNMYIKL